MFRKTIHAAARTVAPTESEGAALAWFARCDRGLKPEEEQAFEEWLAADPENTRIFNQLDGTWELLERAGPPPVPRSANGEGARRFFRGGFGWAAVGLAAAAAFAVVYSSWWRPANFVTSATTAIGDTQTIKLPDGSVVTLNTDSSIQVSMTTAERRIRLDRGEAQFSVAKNAARPFWVEAAGVAVRAVGTAFDVRLRTTWVEVLVTEGRVQVNDAAKGGSLLPDPVALDPKVPLSPPAVRVLEAGEFAVIPVGLMVTKLVPSTPYARVVTVTPDEIRRQLEWQVHRLDFVGAPLAQMVEEFNRYNRHQLIIADPGLGSRRFGGSFKSDDYSGFIRMLRDNFEVKTEEKEGQTTLSLGR